MQCTLCGAVWSQESQAEGYEHKCSPPARGMQREQSGSLVAMTAKIAEK